VLELAKQVPAVFVIDVTHYHAFHYVISKTGTISAEFGIALHMNCMEISIQRVNSALAPSFHLRPRRFGNLRYCWGETGIRVAQTALSAVSRTASRPRRATAGEHWEWKSDAFYTPCARQHALRPDSENSVVQPAGFSRL